MNHINGQLRACLIDKALTELPPADDYAGDFVEVIVHVQGDHTSKYKVRFEKTDNPLPAGGATLWQLKTITIG
ncbi:MAG: hypothetical protein INR69_07700 [Mucilaginibacter polytrichastri]|nr:hypothetical protein [Mucilaginibacter polytrichastri]